MLNLLAAVLVAAAPAAPATNAPSADAHAQHQMMDHEAGDMKPAMIAGMKDCCCKDMMSKKRQGQSEDHSGHSGR